MSRVRDFPSAWNGFSYRSELEKWVNIMTIKKKAKLNYRSRKKRARNNAIDTHSKYGEGLRRFMCSLKLLRCLKRFWESSTTNSTVFLGKTKISSEFATGVVQCVTANSWLKVKARKTMQHDEIDQQSISILLQASLKCRDLNQYPNTSRYTNRTTLSIW